MTSTEIILYSILGFFVVLATVTTIWVIRKQRKIVNETLKKQKSSHIDDQDKGDFVHHKNDTKNKKDEK